MNKQTEEALRMAIDDLELCNGAETVENIIIYTTESINACKAALEQPSMTYEQGFAHGYEAHRVETALDKMAENARELGLEYCKHGSDSACKECYMENVEQEPVAWKYKTNKVHTWITEDMPPEDAYDENTLTPLYTRPTKPLSDDEINVFINPMPQNIQNDDLREFARAIEKAHGIGVKDE